MGKFFESLLWNSRYSLVVGVVCCLVTAISLIFIGCAELFKLLYGTFLYLSADEGASKAKLILSVVEILDTFLLSSVLFIFSFGLYELFISALEESKQHESKAFQINSIDELKAKLGKVVVMILVIKVFSYLLEIKPTNFTEMLYMAVIVLLVSISLWLGQNKK